jgi:molybdopterin synthase sulfur carrier subunit
MTVTVKIPAPLQSITGNAEVTAAPGAVIEIIKDLERQFPGIAERISENGKIRRFINLYVNEEDVRFLQSEQTVIKDGDELLIVPAVSGG